MAEKVKASNRKCCNCDKKAVAFWPVIDPDIPSYPYCKECLEAAKTSLLIAMHDEGLLWNK